MRHEQDLDVLPADVADDVDVAEVLDGRHHVRDRLDDVHVGAQRFLEDVRRVASRAEADHVEGRTLIVDGRLDLREQLLGIGDRVALRELVLFRQDVTVLVDEHGLRRSRAAVEADDAAHLLARAEGRRLEARDRIGAAELFELGLLAHERRPRRVAELCLPSAVDERFERIEAAIRADAGRFVQPVHDRAVRGVVLRVGRHENQFLERHVGRVLEPARSPRLWNPLAPARLQEREERIRAAEQQHLRPQRVAARQDRKVLHDDRVGQRAHDLGRRDPRLHQVDDVGFGEHAALGRDVVQPRRIPRQLHHLLARHADLEEALVDRRAGA